MTKTSGLPRRNIDKTPAALNSFLERVLAGTHGEEEQIRALRRAIEGILSFPTEALVIDEPVSNLEIEYDGKRRRGLTARCRGGNGAEHSISVSDLVFPMDSLGASYVSAYRTW